MPHLSRAGGRSFPFVVALALVTTFTSACDGNEGGADASMGDGGATCEPVLCRLGCMYGFARGPDGCERCECAPEPDNSCGAPTDCGLAERPDCCSCAEGYSNAQIDADPCLVRPGEAVPPGCEPDPEVCALVDCVPCEPATDVDCASGECVGVR